MNKFYIKFSLLIILFCSLSGSLLGQVTMAEYRFSGNWSPEAGEIGGPSLSGSSSLSFYNNYIYTYDDGQEIELIMSTLGYKDITVGWKGYGSKRNGCQWVLSVDGTDLRTQSCGTSWAVDSKEIGSEFDNKGNVSIKITSSLNKDQYVCLDDLVITGTPISPTVTSITPTEACIGGTVVMSGTNFTGESFVELNGVPIPSNNFSVDNNTQITITVPPGATTGLLKVINANNFAESNSSLKIKEALTLSANIINDDCGVGNNGRIDLTVDSGISSSLNFAGTNQPVDLGDNFLSNRGEFTLEGWVKFTANMASGQHSLFGQNDVVEFGFESGYLKIWTANGGSATYEYTSFPVDGEWHHVAATGDGSSLELYIDGANVASGGSGTTSYGSSSSTVKFGAGVWDPGSTSEPFEGEISVVRFWQIARSDDQILDGRFVKLTGSEAGLLAAYRLDEAIGTSLTGVGPQATTPITFSNEIVWNDNPTSDNYTYAWTKQGDGSYIEAKEDLEKLAIGTYEVTVSVPGCSASDSYEVGLVPDDEDPIAICQDITVQLDASGKAIITSDMIDNGSTDNCTIASLIPDPTEFTTVGDKIVILTVTDASGNSNSCDAIVTVVDYEEPSEIQIPFEQRTSQYTPEKKIYNVKGDFTMIGNTNLTLRNYRDDRNNSNYDMVYVDDDDDTSTLNSSSATLGFSTENGAKPQCSNIIYAGLYWTGRANNSSRYDFKVWNGSKYLDKREIRIKHADGSAYQEITARDEDIYYPIDTESSIYAAYAEVTDYVQVHGIGEYFVADMPLSEGDGGSTGFCGGWGLVVVYENSKMKWRDVTLFDGYAYVSHSGSGNTSYDFPISGFKAVQSGDVNIKLGLMASEGDVGIDGDFMQIQNAAQDGWVSLTHNGNSADNFFNSSIETGDNFRDPDLKNNTGVDISMFDVPNGGNLNIANGQTRTKFKYGTSQDAYAIFALAMAVDAYVPEAEATNIITHITGLEGEIVDGTIVNPSDIISYQLDIRNRGTEAVDDARFVLPIPYTTEFVSANVNVGSVAYDPSEGATGSIVWEIGNLPIPLVGPDEVLGTLTYSLKVTTDCSILGNPNCDPSVGVGGGGGSSGTGATSGSISGFSVIQGYETDGECIGEPIVTPIEIQIDADDYVAANCGGEIETEQEYFFCNLGSSGSISITEVSGNFPAGCRFYDDYPVVDGITEEFTVSNDFLADEGTEIYYAVPPGYTSCYYTFKITVKNIDTVPLDVSDVEYCQGNEASKLQASPSIEGYTLFYYTEENGGTPYIELIPLTDDAITTTYYVAEGMSSTCLSPLRSPIVVTVKPKPHPIGIFFE